VRLADDLRSSSPWQADEKVATMNADKELVSPVCGELELCGVRPGETLAVLTQEGATPDYARAFLAAASERGADARQWAGKRR
jgi:hypothetical protein